MDLQEFLTLNHAFGWPGRGGMPDEGFIENNCLTFPASWLEVITGVDVAAEYRGVCQSKEDADQLIAEAGGIVSLFERQVSRVHGKRVQRPFHGDVGVIRPPAGLSTSDAVGAIKFGPEEKGLWAVIAKKRALVKQADLIAAWSIPCA